MVISLTMAKIKSLLLIFLNRTVHTDLIKVERLSFQSGNKVKFTITMVKRISTKYFLIWYLHIITISNNHLSIPHLDFQKLGGFMLKLVVNPNQYWFIVLKSEIKHWTADDQSVIIITMDPVIHLLIILVIKNLFDMVFKIHHHI